MTFFEVDTDWKSPLTMEDDGADGEEETEVAD
jgi:hypothetical protein